MSGRGGGDALIQLGPASLNGRHQFADLSLQIGHHAMRVLVRPDAAGTVFRIQRTATISRAWAVARRTTSLWLTIISDC